MSLALLMAITILQADAAALPAPDASATARPAASDAAAAAQAAPPGSTETEDVPTGAPTDDYGFVSWCYGALDEYLAIYPRIIPDLKDIDKTFGSPVHEDVPYAKDAVLEHKALDRFAAAMRATEKASSQPIADQGQADVAQGRGIWAKVEVLPSRQLADAWLFWGVPVRCETTAKSLSNRARETHASN
jgi:hypothetical protein